MKYSWTEIKQLERLLAAEAAGEQIDRRQAHRLAAQLAELCPNIRGTMRLVQDRMAG
jgi:hypothetical protein